MRRIVVHVVPGVLGVIATIVGAVSCSKPQPVSTGGAGGSGGGATNSVTGTANGPSGTNASTGTFGSSNATSSTGGTCNTPNCLGMGMQGGCDSGLAIAGTASDAAKAIGLCQQFVAGAWGLKTATWVEADGTTPLPAAPDPLSYGHGILTKFGSVIKPREGTALLALSSGAARNPGDPGYVAPGQSCAIAGDWKSMTPHQPPAGYPKASPSCSGVGGVGSAIFDSAGLKLVIHTPIDAKSLSFDFDFYTYEFPDYVCSPWNDFFVAMLTPTPMGLPDPNISFDSMNNNISVNAGFLQVCSPQTAGYMGTMKPFSCPKGPGELAGTGFDGHVPDTPCMSGMMTPTNGSAATSWLNTASPIPADTDITLTFAVWDTGDGNLDSTVLIDNFKITTMPLPAGPKTMPM